MRDKNVVFISIGLVLFLFLGIAGLKGDSNLKVSFKKTIEFSDYRDDFLFKNPDKVQVDREGNIYVKDSNRILKLSGSGKFKKILNTQGEGPGEVTYLHNFLIHDDTLFIYNHFPEKIIEMTTDGRLIREFRIKKYLDRFFAVYGKRFYYIVNELPLLKGENGRIIDIDWHLTGVSSKGEIEQIKDCKFPVRTFAARKGTNYGEIRLGRLLVKQLKDNYFCVTNSTEYEIKLLDIEKQAVVKTFKREYDRQETPEEIAKKLKIQGFQLAARIYRRPPQKYLNDIRQLLVYKSSLWVVTSTVDEKKGVLVDVYNKDCRFTGSFYLKLSDRLSYSDYFSFHAYIFGEFLYIIERDQDDNPWIVKYKIDIGEELKWKKKILQDQD